MEDVFPAAATKPMQMMWRGRRVIAPAWSDMKRVPKVSAETMQTAFEMGCRMAHTERRVIPYLSGAHHYTNYTQFLLMHRHHLEAYPAFEAWDAKIIQLAEREARLLGVRSDTRQGWEAAHNHIEVPLRSSFWFGWETVYRLKHLFEQQIELRRRMEEPSAILRVHNPPMSPLIPCSPLPDKFADDASWDNLAIEMFEDLDGASDESLGQMAPMPEPDAGRDRR